MIISLAPRAALCDTNPRVGLLPREAASLSRWSRTLDQRRLCAGGLCPTLGRGEGREQLRSIL